MSDAKSVPKTVMEKVADLKKNTPAELQKMLADKQGELRKLRFQVVQGQQKNIRTIRGVKRTIARILTILGDTDDTTDDNNDTSGQKDSAASDKK